MKSQLYLWENLRNEFKKELTYIYELYFERIEPVFSNAETEAEKLSEKTWEDVTSAPWDGEIDVELSYIAESCQEIGLERYEILSLMRYRNLAMWISCLYQSWEQQIMRFAKKEIETDGCFELTRSMDFAIAKEIFEIHNCPIDELSCWKKIKELRTLVNVIKHSGGNSAETLRQLRPDFFGWEDIHDFSRDRLQFFESTLLDETLNIKNEDFTAYYKSLIAFWDELSKCMYSDDLEILKEKSDIIFVGGIHGVGKSYFCDRITSKTNLRTYSASKLIAELKNEQFKSDKLIADIRDNQNYLLDAVNRISEKEYILDGHFCLLNSSGEVERIPLDTFKRLPIKAIMVIYDDVSKIVARLNERDGIKHNETTFEKFQNEELSYAKEIAELLCVTFTIINCESYIEDAAKHINKWLTK